MAYQPVQDDENSSQSPEFFKENDPILRELHSLFSKLFTKEYLENDDFFSKYSNAAVIPLDFVISSPQVQRISTNDQLVKRALETSNAIILSEDGIRPVVRGDQHVIILRDVDASVTEASIREALSLASIPSPLSTKPEMNNTWFLTLACEADARITLDKLKHVTLCGKPVRGRLKTESTARTLYQGPPTNRTYRSPPEVSVAPEGYYLPHMPPHMMVPMGSPSQPMPMPMVLPAHAEGLPGVMIPPQQMFYMPYPFPMQPGMGFMPPPMGAPMWGVWPGMASMPLQMMQMPSPNNNNNMGQGNARRNQRGKGSPRGQHWGAQGTYSTGPSSPNRQGGRNQRERSGSSGSAGPSSQASAAPAVASAPLSPSGDPPAGSVPQADPTNTIESLAVNARPQEVVPRVDQGQSLDRSPQRKSNKFRSSSGSGSGDAPPSSAEPASQDDKTVPAATTKGPGAVHPRVTGSSAVDTPQLKKQQAAPPPPPATNQVKDRKPNKGRGGRERGGRGGHSKQPAVPPPPQFNLESDFPSLSAAPLPPAPPPALPVKHIAANSLNSSANPGQVLPISWAERIQKPLSIVAESTSQSPAPPTPPPVPSHPQDTPHEQVATESSAAVLPAPASYIDPTPHPNMPIPQREVTWTPAHPDPEKRSVAPLSIDPTAASASYACIPVEATFRAPEISSSHNLGSVPLAPLPPPASSSEHQNLPSLTGLTELSQSDVPCLALADPSEEAKDKLSAPLTEAHAQVSPSCGEGQSQLSSANHNGSNHKLSFLDVVRGGK